MKCKDLDTKKFEYFCSRAAAGIGILILGFLSLYCLFYTEEFVTNSREELQLSDGLPLLTLALIVYAAACFYGIVRRILQKEEHRQRNVRILLAITCAYVAVLGFVWAVRCRYEMPTFWDSQMVSRIADILANGTDKFNQRDLNYISAYPHQLGMVALLEQLYRIFGWENYRAFQALNALGAAGIVFVGHRLSVRISGREETGVWFLLLMFFCWPLIIYVAFIYGEILSIFFSLLSLDVLMGYLEKKRKRDILYLTLSITAACLIRSNCYIVLAAIGCVLAVKAVSEKTFRHLAALLSCILLFFLAHTALVKVYEQRIGIDLGQGMPTILWVAMGTQEGENGKEAGWYNHLYSWDIFVEETDLDQEESVRRAEEILEAEAEKYREDPSYMLDFYGRKIVSQWCEPTYAGLVETNHYDTDTKRGFLMEGFYKGRLWQPFVRLMDVYQSFIYCGALAFLLFLIRRKIPVEHLGLLITVIGGFLFYIVWEAKSRYVFPYFVMLIPMAASGWDMLVQKTASWVKECRENRLAAGKKIWRVPLERLEPWAGRLVLIGAGIPSVLLFLYSLLFTTVYENSDPGAPSQAQDPVFLLLLGVAAGFAALCLAGRLLLKNERERRRNVNLLLCAVLLHCAVFCTAWNLLAQGSLQAEPLYLHMLAEGFVTGSIPEAALDYLYTYPRQAGQAFLLELVYRIFGCGNLFAFRMLNTFGVLVFVYSGYRITELLYIKDAVKVNFLLLAAGCVPLLIYTNVMDGEVAAAAAVAFAFWMLLLWLGQEKLWQFALLTLAFVFAAYMKGHALIAAVAAGVVMLCKAAAGRRAKLAAFVVPFTAMILLAQPVMTEFYEERSGCSLDQGMPANLQVAMGLQGEGMASGWWNGFPDRVYKEQVEYDAQYAKALGDAAIDLSLSEMAKSPKASAVFFARKFVSQWNDASYGCLVTSGGQDTPAAEFWMNLFHSLVFLGAAGFVLLRFWRPNKIEECLPFLVLLGGYLFYLAWEAKGRYGLFFFVLLLPSAAAGLEEFRGFLERQLDKRKKKES